MSAVATKPSSSSGGLFGWLTGGGSRSLPPLDFPLAGVILPPSLPDYIEPSKTKITTLPNGVKIASEASAVSMIWSLSFVLFIIEWIENQIAH